jgi:Tfp pilus assembly protein PilN
MPHRDATIVAPCLSPLIAKPAACPQMLAPWRSALRVHLGEMMKPALLRPLVLLLTGLALAACGHTEEEMAAKQRDIAVLTSRLGETSDQLRRESASVDEAKAQLADLAQQVDRLRTEASTCTAPAPAKPVPRWATSYSR